MWRDVSSDGRLVGKFVEQGVNLRMKVSRVSLPWLMALYLCMGSELVVRSLIFTPSPLLSTLLLAGNKFTEKRLILAR